MKKFLIRREMKGASSIPKHEMNKGGKASEDVLEEMRNEGKMIQQETSYVAGDNVFCSDHSKQHSSQSTLLHSYGSVSSTASPRNSEVMWGKPLGGVKL